MTNGHNVCTWSLAALLLVTAGCVSQGQYDAIARANLQLQDKLAASQADRVKARTQIALLRQDLVQARQARQEAVDQLQAAAVETDTLRAQLELRTGRAGHVTSTTRPATTRPAE